jgi:hypothetical protein
LVPEATEDEDDPDFERGEEEEEGVSMAELVKKRETGRDFSGGEIFLLTLSECRQSSGEWRQCWDANQRRMVNLDYRNDGSSQHKKDLS